MRGLCGLYVLDVVGSRGGVDTLMLTIIITTILSLVGPCLLLVTDGLEPSVSWC
jgi:hypothetical protein